MGSRPVGRIIFLMVFFLSLILQCEFNINVSTQILLLFLPLMMPRPPAPAALWLSFLPRLVLKEFNFPFAENKM